MYELFISHDGVIYSPSVVEVSLYSQRASAPACLKFSYLLDNVSFSEGDCVKFSCDNIGVFFGYIFTVKSDKNNLISITAYDQLRYFKNKDTYLYEGKKASEIVCMLAEDFGFKLGEIEDTGYIIPYAIEENSTLFDMVQNALDLTIENTSQMFILYDDCGSICLKNIFSLTNNLLIDEATASNFSLTSSIDENTYNKVKLTYENSSTGERNIFTAFDESNINSWGVLQYSGTLKEGENGVAKAISLMDLHDKKSRSLTIKSALGDIKVRSGSLVTIKIGQTNSVMLVEKATHKFTDNSHLMDLVLV